MEAKIRAEWDRLAHVVVRHPGIEFFFGLLDPKSSLFERYFDFSEACNEHSDLIGKLERNDVKVDHLDEIVVRAAENDKSLFKELLEKAIEKISFKGHKRLARRAYKRFKENAHLLDKKQLFEIMMLRPVVKLSKPQHEKTVYAQTTIKNPPSNLCFMRDQQAVTDRGLVIGRMAKVQRAYESTITEFALNKLGVQPLYKIRADGTFEGGDFIPAGSFAMLGCGKRTNREAVNQMLTHCLGFDEVAVVSQPAHPKLGVVDEMMNMHLDTYVNIAGKDIAVGNVEMMSNAKLKVYRRRNDGTYAGNDTDDLYSYLTTKKNFQVVNITELEQMCYASNFLCISDKRIICADVEAIAPSVLDNLKRELPRKPAKLRWKYEALHTQASRTSENLKARNEFFPNKPELVSLGVSAEKVKLTQITGAYGATHCLTCVLVRQ